MALLNRLYFVNSAFVKSAVNSKYFQTNFNWLAHRYRLYIVAGAVEVSFIQIDIEDCPCISCMFKGSTVARQCCILTN